MSEIKKGKHISIKTEFGKGDKHPNWKGGIRKLSGQIRDLKEYNCWRKHILYRDNFTCQICRKRGGRLEVDHFPTLFKDIFHNNKISSLEEALECKDFWDLNNGRVLCKSCHKLLGNPAKKIK